MKKIICILTAVMLVFAVSCSNDTPSVDSHRPVINAPEFNTDYSQLTDYEKMDIIYSLLNIASQAQMEAADPLTDAAIAEAESDMMAGSTKGSVSKSNSDGTVKVVIYYDIPADVGDIGIYYIGYDIGNYTIWGSWEDDEEYTFRDNTLEIENTTKVRVEYPDGERPVYYLNDVLIQDSF